ncbi:sulfate adenylyltransferase [Geodermatophilus bullaregiensis]|uniref:sulfate adenylyltransferase n=1 Tax=Geodermatophilus bullaregiensis TaxID=1564160 RepID=UPI00195A6226|nr:sulfate adenylyltransferase [Geodermatophilus bullaregiensis]MBM7808953.1 sulfate adenylyltransferase [Geodermatophilus bullaregiensis]
MTDVPGPPAHGGTLVDLRVTGGRAAEVATAARFLPGWELTRRQRCDLELLATGGFSPLRTFMGPADHAAVCASMRLTSGELWPVPVTLDLPEHVVEAATAAGGLTLRARGADLAVLWLQTAWRPDRPAEAAAVLGTTDPSHPGVRALLSETNPWCVSGPLEVLALPVHAAFRSLRHTPAEVRREIADRGWDRVVAFQTRNPMHRAHQQLTVRAARDLDADLLLHPVVGVTKPGDVDPYVRVRCYRALLPTYPPGTAMLSLLPLAMRMAGPREALWHAIVRKNHGATHFIVGRDHAGPGPDAQGRPFYDPYAAQDLVRRHERELGIGVVPFRQMVYVRELQEYVPEDEVRPGQHCLRISGTEQRRRLARGEELPAWFTPPEVAAELRRAFPPRSARGLGVLVGPGLEHGDRIAAAVAAQLREAGRTVTVLDSLVWTGGGATARLVARLVGEIMLNGGAVVCSGELARQLTGRTADAPDVAPAPGFLLDVRPGETAPEAGDEAFPDGDRDSLTVPPEASAELVAELVCRRLGALGHPAQPPATDRGPRPVDRAALVGSG